MEYSAHATTAGTMYAYIRSTDEEYIRGPEEAWLSDKRGCSLLSLLGLRLGFESVAPRIHHRRHLRPSRCLIACIMANLISLSRQGLQGTSGVRPDAPILSSSSRHPFRNPHLGEYTGVLSRYSTLPHSRIRTYACLRSRKDEDGEIARQTPTQPSPSPIHSRYSLPSATVRSSVRTQLLTRTPLLRINPSVPSVPAVLGLQSSPIYGVRIEVHYEVLRNAYL